MNTVARHIGSATKWVREGKKYPLRLLFVGAILISLVVSLTLAWNDSQTIDEAAHIAAGASYVETGDFRLNPEHPILFKLAIGAFVSPLDTRPATQLEGWEEADQWSAGKDLLYSSSTDHQTILFFARIPTVIYTLLLIIATYFLGKKLYGETVGLIAGSFLALDPTILAHGHLATNDMLLALSLVVFILTAITYAKEPTYRHLFIVTLAAVLCANAKFSGIVVIAGLAGFITWKHRKQWAYVIKQLCVLAGIVLIGTWILYGFQVSSIDRDIHGEQTIAVSLPASVTKLPIPAYTYVRGVATLFFHNSDGHKSYIFGNTNTTGKIYYVPVAVVTKLPDTVLLAGIFITSGLLHRKKSRKLFSDRSYLWLIAPTLIFVGLAMTSNINIGVRHALQTWPLIYILVSYLGYTIYKKQRLFMPVIIIFLIVTTLGFANPLAYKNVMNRSIEKLINAPVLADSNLDWSQDIYRLRNYIASKNITTFGEALFTNIPLGRVIASAQTCEIDSTNQRCMNGEEAPCTIAISDTARWQNKQDYAWVYQNYDEIDRVGGSISIFNCKKL